MSGGIGGIRGRLKGWYWVVGLCYLFLFTTSAELDCVRFYQNVIAFM